MLEGTKRTSGIALAGVEGLATPDCLHNHYDCVLLEERREAFDRFCKERPVIYGKYFQEKKS